MREPKNEAIRSAIRDAFTKAAEIVRKKNRSRNTYYGFSDTEETRAHSEAVDEAVEEALREVADSFDAVSEALQRSVLDVKLQVLQEAGVADHFQFNRLSRAHGDFFSKLNRIGSDRGASHEPGDPFPPDVDEAAKLTDEEAEALVAEARALNR
jgi:hypothetical protein